MQRRKHNSSQFTVQTGWVQVAVVDSGEGIPEEELEHIFDRFYRVDKARERENGGTGLGLAIAKEFIQAHGGSIQVESKRASGSCFRIFLPVKQNCKVQSKYLNNILRSPSLFNHNTVIYLARNLLTISIIRSHLRTRAEKERKHEQKMGYHWSLRRCGLRRGLLDL